MPNPNPQPDSGQYREVSETSKLTELELEVIRSAASVHASALQFCRMDFEDFNARSRTADKPCQHELAQSLRELSMAAALSQAIHIFLLEPNTEAHLNQILQGLRETCEECHSDLFFEKVNNFGKQLSDLSMQRRAMQQAKRLSCN